MQCANARSFEELQSSNDLADAMDCNIANARSFEVLQSINGFAHLTEYNVAYSDTQLGDSFGLYLRMTSKPKIECPLELRSSLVVASSRDISTTSAETLQQVLLT